eukprot:8570271-Alexandrium_andersonii.AAC.1
MGGSNAADAAAASSTTSSITDTNTTPLPDTVAKAKHTVHQTARITLDTHNALNAGSLVRDEQHHQPRP